jgi:hypothetical protein
MRFIVIGMVLLVAVGCGPMQRPMVYRLEAEQQKTVDQCWENIMARQQKIDHQGLLDVMITYYLPTIGIDSAQYHAEKTVGDKLVAFDVIFDRTRPQRDAFSVTVFDSRGTIIRQEKYTRSEVDQTCIDLSLGTTEEPIDVDELVARQRIERRHAEVVAATQPFEAKK